MKLFLASEGKDPRTLEKLEPFLGGYKDKSIVFIPTAGNGNWYGFWRERDTFKIVSSLGWKNFEPVELEDTRVDSVSKIAAADVIWVNGGFTGYLLYWMRRLQLEKHLPEFLKKGAVYVGSSAGSMAVSKTQFWSEHLIGEEEPGASLIPGLGLVDFEFYPHYDDSLYAQIREMTPKGIPVRLVKNGEVVTIIDKKVEVLGEERILLQR